MRGQPIMYSGILKKFIAGAASLLLAACAAPGTTTNYAGAGYYDDNSYDYYGGGDPAVDFDYFYDALSPYGEWSYHPRWGRVWSPYAGADFRPYYSNGYWQNTFEFGWTWVSDYPWGRIPFHYGRWVYDPFDGWIWLPGYVWAPSWTIWRSGGGYLGWFPMPPTNDFLLGVEIYRNDWHNWDRGFGYADWYGPHYGSNWLFAHWAFVRRDRFGDRDFRRSEAPRNRVIDIARTALDVTNYTTVDDYVVNRSIESDTPQSESDGRRRRPAREVLGDDAPILQASLGRAAAQRDRGRLGRDPGASPRERLRPLPVDAVTNEPVGDPAIVQQPVRQNGGNGEAARTARRQQMEQERAARQQRREQRRALTEQQRQQVEERTVERDALRVQQQQLQQRQFDRQQRAQERSLRMEQRRVETEQRALQQGAGRGRAMEERQPSQPQMRQEPRRFEAGRRQAPPAERSRMMPMRQQESAARAAQREATRGLRQTQRAERVQMRRQNESNAPQQ